LIGWRIDIKSEEEKRAEIESQIERMQAAPTPLSELPGLTPSLLQKLTASGLETVEQLANLSPEDLKNIPGIGEKTLEKIGEVLGEFYAQQPTYTEDLERLAAEHMFSKDEPEPEPEPAEEPAGAESNPDKPTE